jgi:hypothetical protein
MQDTEQMCSIDSSASSAGFTGAAGAATASSASSELRGQSPRFFKLVRSAGNGSCLFISLRLGLELLTLIKMNDSGQSIQHGIIDGHHSAVLESAECLRNDVIIQWFQNGLSKTVPSFGVFDVKSQKPWTRGDIIIMETANLIEGDAPDDPAKRLELQQSYLKHMRSEKISFNGRTDYRKRNWGGQAEYTAFALIAKVTVEVWHFKKGLLVKHNEIASPESTGTFKILFNGSNHYDLLLSNEEAAKIHAIVPEARISSF